MRILLAGILGAIVAVALWLGLEHFTQMNLGWLACAVGAITGLCVHWAAGATADSSYGRGALSVVLALVAIVGGRQVYVKIMASNAGIAGATAISAPVISATEQDEEQQDTREKTDTVTLQAAKVPKHPLQTAGKRGGSQVSLERSLSELDMVWMCLAALAAYILGKGRDKIPTAETAAEVASESDERSSP